MSHSQKYIYELQREFETGHAKEHAYRPALKTFLENLLEDVQAINEPKQQKWGSPDYVITKKRKGEAIPVGYIEAKDIDVNLDKIEDTEQLKRYRKDLDNLILTNYREFRFFKNGEKVISISIAEIDDFFSQKKSIKPDPDKFGQLEALLLNFVGFMGQTLKSPKELAEKMANKAQLMRDVFRKALDDKDEPSKTLQEQHKAFQQILIHDMDTAQFADVYAQTIAYGLFTARLHDTTLADFSRNEARDLIPKSNPFLRKLFDYVCGADLEEGVKWIIDELCEVYRAADIKAILAGFGKQSGRDDPIVHFYETFLGAYDAKLRKARGVWYTPEPVVNFIVRAIDEVLQTHFNLPDGLANTSKVKIKVEENGQEVEREVHRVQLLDVAAGTGTFTAEAIKQIHAKFENAGQMGLWSNYVEQDLLPRLHGFEILMASYAMCHLKIDMLLTELGYKPSNPKNPPRLGVYLTNALEEYHPDANTLFGSWLAAEANEASRIKRDMPIMVAYGNPPYSVSSQNKGEFIQKLVADYKKDLNEKNINPLSDDYIKFIRYAEHYVEKTGYGIVAMITNNSFYDGIIHRQMRKHLMGTFDHIYIYDLHGSANKKETALDGSKDQNVFDIMQGVGISIFVKDGSRKGELAQVMHYDSYGTRQEKYEKLWEQKLLIELANVLTPNMPNRIFVPKNDLGQKNYELGFLTSELFIVFAAGIKTERDHLVVSFSADVLTQVIGDFKRLESEQFRVLYGEGPDGRDWQMETAKNDILKNNPKIADISFRPFDSRKAIYTGKTKGIMSYPRNSVMKHMFSENFAVLLPRQSATSLFGFFVSDKICDGNFTGNAGQYGAGQTFPLYLYPDERAKDHAVQGDLLSEKTAEVENPSVRKPNLNPEIVAQISAKLGLAFVPDHEIEQPENSFNPLDLLDYIYAVLHSPTYREKYKEFLKIDFPRIPFPENATNFWQLVALGREIRGFHLLEHPALSKLITTFPEGGDCIVIKPSFMPPSVADADTSPVNRGGQVHINSVQYFGNVPQIAWDFYIGGYQPAQKWLKDRKGRKLSPDDIKHYQKIIIALVNTDRLMKEIDEVWKP